MAAGLVLRCWVVMELVPGVPHMVLLQYQSGAVLVSEAVSEVQRRGQIVVCWCRFGLYGRGRLHCCHWHRCKPQSVADRALNPLQESIFFLTGFQIWVCCQLLLPSEIVVDRCHNCLAVGPVLLLVYLLKVRPRQTVFLICHVQPQRCGEDTLHHSSPAFRRRSVASSS